MLCFCLSLCWQQACGEHQRLAESQRTDNIKGFNYCSTEQPHTQAHIIVMKHWLQKCAISLIARKESVCRYVHVCVFV